MGQTQQGSPSPDRGAVLNMLRNAASRTTIDGVTTLFSPTSGPTRATLSFRVGTTDEALHERGISHVVGHLASHMADQSTRDCPVTVSASTLSFHFSGNALAVANEIGAACHWFTSATTSPIDRRALEIAKARARADRSPYAAEHLPVLAARFGMSWASGASAEDAIDQLTADDIARWVGTYFVTGNAVLALSGTKAMTLRAPLSAGDYVPLPALPAQRLVGPTLIDAAENTVNLSGVIVTDPRHLDRDRAAADITTDIARSRATAAVRRRFGSQVAVRGGTMAIGPGAVHAALYAGASSSDIAKLADIATESVELLCSNKLVDGELAAHIARRTSTLERYAATADGAHRLLHRQALGALNDTPWSPALERRMIASTTADAIGVQLDSWAHTLVLSMPPTDPPVRRWSARQETMTAPADGDVFRSRPAYGLRSTARPERLFVGDTGITMRSTTSADRHLRWSEVAVERVWDDGRRQLVDEDGRIFDVRPERWLAPDLIDDAIRRRLPNGTPRVGMGKRTATAPSPLRITDRVSPFIWWLLGGVALIGIALTVAPLWSTDSISRWVVLAGSVVLAVVAGCFVADTFLTEQRLRRTPQPPSD